MKTIKVDKTFSKGIVQAKAFIVEKQDLIPDNYEVTGDDKKTEEVDRYKEAVSKAGTQIQEIVEQSPIFAGHLEILNDVALLDSVVSKITNDGMNAQRALDATKEEFVAIFESMDNEYMRERSADVKDVCNRIMRCSKGFDENPFASIKEEVIVVAEDLAPSDTAVMDFSLIKGFITQEGGVTSHVSIMARGMGIPALVGVKDILKEVKTDDYVIMDAREGTIVLNPDQETKDEYTELEAEFNKREAELREASALPAVTPDGRDVMVAANVGSIEEVKKAVEANVDGIGLFRSEFLYMDGNQFPSEEEQFEAYKAAAVELGKEVIIRTLDIGGDKSLPYYEFDEEENPFLGWRAIRISLDLEDVFKAQLRALLRASAFGEVKIMYPMIISLEELFEANKVLDICKAELREEGIDFDEDIKVGMMIETPASVMNVDEFAKHVDFFSIGTNDLTQYMLAVDRGNKKIEKMFNSFHPAVIRAIAKVIKAGHDNNIMVGMCGEFAGDEKATKLLLGLGLDEFSMSSSEVANIKNIIRHTNYEDAKEIANKALSVYTVDDMMECIE